MLIYLINLYKCTHLSISNRKNSKKIFSGHYLNDVKKTGKSEERKEPLLCPDSRTFILLYQFFTKKMIIIFP